MSDKKLKFSSFLEMASATLPDSFSSQTLGTVPNERDEDDPEDKDELLRKKLQTMMGTTQENSDDESNEDGDARLFKILKGFLTHDEGDGGDSEDGPHDDSPSGVDHDETKDMGPYPLNDDPNDAPHAGDTADEKYADDKHNQLMGAINDLRNELKGKSGKSQTGKWKVSRMEEPEEQEEDATDVCGRCNGSGKDVGRKCIPCRGTGMIDYSKDRDTDHDYLRGETEEENEESYEEDEQEDTKQARARQMFTALVNQGSARQDIIDSFMKNIGVTNSTATSYYQRLAKEAGLTTSGDREMPGQGDSSGLGVAAGMQPQQGMPGGAGGEEGQAGMGMPQQPESNIDGFEVQDDPNRQGLIRTVKGAHLVYKRKNEEGTYDELWVFGTGENDIKDSLEVRRAILAGTDIPPRAMKSENGDQSYTLTSLGNGQILHIKGLPN